MAKDEDVGLNALVKYRLKPDLFGNYKSFSIDENSGLVTLKVALNREKQKLYEVRMSMELNLRLKTQITIFLQNTQLVIT